VKALLNNVLASAGPVASGIVVDWGSTLTHPPGRETLAEEAPAVPSMQLSSGLPPQLARFETRPTLEGQFWPSLHLVAESLAAALMYAWQEHSLCLADHLPPMRLCLQEKALQTAEHWQAYTAWRVKVMDSARNLQLEMDRFRPVEN